MPLTAGLSRACAGEVGSPGPPCLHAGCARAGVHPADGCMGGGATQAAVRAIRAPMPRPAGGWSGRGLPCGMRPAGGCTHHSFSFPPGPYKERPSPELRQQAQEPRRTAPQGPSSEPRVPVACRFQPGPGNSFRAKPARTPLPTESRRGSAPSGRYCCSLIPTAHFLPLIPGKRRPSSMPGCRFARPMRERGHLCSGRPQGTISERLG
jgi:hypothetical protein